MTSRRSPRRWHALVLGVPAVLLLATATAIVTFVAVDGGGSGSGGVVVAHRAVPAHEVVAHLTHTVF